MIALLRKDKVGAFITLPILVVVVRMIVRIQGTLMCISERKRQSHLLPFIVRVHMFSVAFLCL